MRPVILSERMKMIAGLVPKGSSVCDVGCDHAYISVYLAQQGIADKIIASDLRPGPLETARANIEAYGLSDKIRTRLSDGLKEIRPGETDTVLISGMGGELIIRILKEGKETVDKAARLILSPQSVIPDVRRYIEENGFKITDEVMTKEDGKYYVGILAENLSMPAKDTSLTAGMKNDGTETAAKISQTGDKEGTADTQDMLHELNMYFGETLLKKQDRTLKEFLEHRKEILGRIMEGLEKSESDNISERKNEINRELEMIRKAGKIYYGM